MPRHLVSLALAIVLAAPAYAQDINSTSGSAANANSGSVSGAESNGNQQGQAQTQNNAGIGSSSSDSTSNSGAVSGSTSNSGAVSDQAQGQSQGQSANNSQGQSQGQSASQTLTAGQQATNQQGVSVSNTFNSTPLKRTYVGTNTAVPLAASSSFSSDYCGGTVSGGASAAPIGISIGGAAPSFDNSCRYLRLAEKAGMLGANYHNMQQPESALKAMSLMTWAVCMAGPQQDKRHKGYNENLVMEACLKLGLLGGGDVPMTPPPAYVPPIVQPQQAPVTPLETQKPNTTPYGSDDYSDLPPKTPRGEIQREDNRDTAFAATLPQRP